MAVLNVGEQLGGIVHVLGVGSGGHGHGFFEPLLHGKFGQGFVFGQGFRQGEGLGWGMPGQGIEGDNVLRELACFVDVGHHGMGDEPGVVLPSFVSDPCAQCRIGDAGAGNAGAPGANRGQQLLKRWGSEDHGHPLRGLFEGFEKGIGGLRGHLVGMENTDKKPMSSSGAQLNIAYHLANRVYRGRVCGDDPNVGVVMGAHLAACGA